MFDISMLFAATATGFAVITFCWFHESSFKIFSIVFLLPNWLKLNHLKSRMEWGFSGIFSHHIYSTVAETIGVTSYTASFGAKNVQKTTFEAAEMMLGSWNQQIDCQTHEDKTYFQSRQEPKSIYGLLVP